MHFPAKDDLLFAADDYFGADRLEPRLTARPAGQPALETLRQWLIETISEISSSRADHASLYWRARALRARLIGENDRLRGLARLLRDRRTYPHRGHRQRPPRRA
jgi:hypothetical protein